jgi:DNA-binding transcriptional ArsR family regulator
MSKTVLVMGDEHFPNQNRVFVRLMLDKIIPDLKPDIGIHIGDTVTADGLAARTRLRPPTTPTLEDEIPDIIDYLQACCDASPKTQWYFIEGNHEDWLTRRSMEVGGLYGLRFLNWPALLGLDKMSMKFIPMRDGLRLGPVLYIHGVKTNKWGGYTAKNTLDQLMVPCVVGHCHRLAIHRRAFSTPMISAEAGCMCDWYAEGYPRSKPDWHIGAIVVHYTDAWVDMAMISYTPGRAVMGGQVWENATVTSRLPATAAEVRSPPSPRRHVAIMDSPAHDTKIRVLSLLVDGGPMRTEDLVVGLGDKATSTVRDAIRKLAIEGLVEQVGDYSRESKHGRSHGKTWQATGAA